MKTSDGKVCPRCCRATWGDYWQWLCWPCWYWCHGVEEVRDLSKLHDTSATAKRCAARGCEGKPTTDFPLCRKHMERRFTGGDLCDLFAWKPEDIKRLLRDDWQEGPEWDESREGG